MIQIAIYSLEHCVNQNVYSKVSKGIVVNVPMDLNVNAF